MKKILYLLLFLILLSSGCISKQRTLDVVFSYSPLTYIPNKSAEIVTISVLMNFYDPLVKFDADFRPTPGLAEYWENPDSITWVFHLRKDVRFKSGKKLSAKDVVYTFQSIQHDSESDYRADIAGIDTVYSTDSETVIFKLKAPCATFLERISQILITQRNCTDSLFKTFSCGTGALSFVKRDTRGNIFATSNTQYFGKHVDFDRVAFIFKSKCPCEIARSNGHTFFLFTFTPEDTCKTRHFLLRIPGPLNSIRYIGINLKKPILNNPFFRKALYYSVCRKDLADSISAYYGNTVIPAYEFALPTQIGYIQIKEPPCNNDSLIASFLNKSGYSGDTIPLLVSDNRYQYARLIKKDFAKHGIFIAIDTVKAHEIFRRVKETGDFDLFLLTLIPQSIDIYSTVEAHFHTIIPQKSLGIKNYFNYSNTQLDSLIDSAGYLLKKSQREPQLKKIESIIVNSLPVIPLLYEGSVYYVSRELQWKPRIDRIILVNEVFTKK